MLTQFINLFATLGLKEAEMEVYFSLLKEKEGLRVQKITSLTKIKRSTVNLIITRLLDQGLISFYLDGQRKIYTAEPPELIFNNFENSLNEFKNFLPVLRKISEKNPETKVRFFNGKKEIEKIFADILLTMRLNKDKNAQEVLAISSGIDIFKILPNHHKQFIEKRVKEHIPIRWISPESEISRTYLLDSKKDLREMKFFDSKKYPFHIEIDIYKNKVAFFSYDDNPVGIIIENKNLSNSFRSLYNLIWDFI